MRPFRRVSAVLALLLVALLANLSWVQVLDADTLRQRPDNTRAVLEQFNRARGPIIVGSQPIATSSRSEVDGFYQRSYTNGPLYAAVTGYSSLLYGSSGIEHTENGLLSGSDSRLFVDRIQQLFAGRRQAGGAVTVTIDAAAQQAAFDALTGQRGATVAIDARTGAIVALVSQPSFDPQVLAPNDPTQVRKAYAGLMADPLQPMLNRATAKAFPLGTAFGVVTVTAALTEGRIAATTLLPGPSTITLDGETVVTANGRPCGSASGVTLERALRVQCSTAFAWLGQALGMDALRSGAQQFGFDVAPNVHLPVVPSVVPTGDDGGAATLAGAGGGGMRATVLQMAMVASAIANRGTLMNPYLVRDVRAQDLAVVDEARPTVRSTPMSQDHARLLGGLLLGIAGSTTCDDCVLGGIPVHSWSGSSGSDGPVWVMAWAGRIAVATLIEDAGAERTAMAASVAVLRSLLVGQ